MSDEIGVKLTIISDKMTASEIDQYLGIKCTESQERGLPNRLGTKRYEHHAWLLKTRYNVSPDEYIGHKIDQQIEALFSKVGGAADKIRDLSRNNRVVFGLYFCSRDVPPLGLSKEQIEAVAALGASLDIDVVLSGDPGVKKDEEKEHITRAD